MTMLLQRLQLSNIRSYTDQIISFPEGSTLLAGDIGCGKSSLLLAIEFALFGTSRPDLPAEYLLRKGSSSGFVELTFLLNQQQITIRRNLKKDKASIKQLAGHLIINDLKKDLLPIELKAEVIRLLGYPEDQLEKNKNYLFRYTVYTPQEEMKLILQEEPDIRIDLLRKIFNLDKYKNIRDNLQVYLKKLRQDILILDNNLSGLEDEQNRLLLLEQEKSSLQLSFSNLAPQLETIQLTINNKRSILLTQETQFNAYLQKRQEYQTGKKILEEKNIQLRSIEERLFSFSHLPKDSSLISKKKEEALARLRQIESEKTKLNETKTTLQLRTIHLQRELTRLKLELSSLEEQLLQLPEKEKQLLIAEDELKRRPLLEEKKKHLEELLEKTTELISKNRTILHHSRDLLQKVSELETCPTCLQKVSPEHKQEIEHSETKTIRQAENLLFDFQKQKLQIIEQKDDVIRQIDFCLKNETLFSRLRSDIDLLLERQSELEKKRSHLLSLEQEKKEDETKLKDMLEKKLLENNDLLLRQQKELLEEISREEYHLKQRDEFLLQRSSLLEQVSLASISLASLEKELQTSPASAEQLSSLRKDIELLRDSEKDLSIRSAQVSTSLHDLSHRISELQGLVKIKSAQKEKLLRLRDLHHWLDSFFLNLTATIEKHVLINIHYHFNLLFQEWFSLLIEDDNIRSRLDDTFTPLIEQNGYEITFQHLSGGEKTSASLAYRLALNKVINDIVQDIRTKDLLILDEPTDGFSSEQLDKVREVLEKLNLKQTIIVSHESKIESFVQNVIRIRKEGHLSTVC
jgi:exonuclease SbcC